MAKSSTKKPELPDLPSLEERIPEAITRLQGMVLRLPTLKAKPILLQEWQRTYALLHGLKGLTKLLPGPPELATTLVAASDFFGRVAHGDWIPTSSAVAELAALADCLGARGKDGTKTLSRLETAMALCPDHMARLKLIPSIVSQPPDLITKIAWAAKEEKWQTITAEAKVQLELFPDWSRRAHDTVENSVGELGCVVHVAPQLQMGDGTVVHAILWAAADPAKIPSLEEAIRGEFPDTVVRVRT